MMSGIIEDMPNLTEMNQKKFAQTLVGQAGSRGVELIGPNGLLPADQDKAVSTRRSQVDQKELLECCPRGEEPQNSSRPFVKLSGDGIEVRLMTSDLLTFGDAIPYQAIRVLIRGFFPRAVRVRERRRSAFTRVSSTGSASNSSSTLLRFPPDLTTSTRCEPSATTYLTREVATTV